VVITRYALRATLYAPRSTRGTRTCARIHAYSDFPASQAL